MYPSLLSSNVDSVAPIGAKETDLHDWKLSPLPSSMLRGWGYQESQHRREIPEATHPWRSLVGRGVATIRRLLATGGGRPTSGAALPQGDRRDLHPG
jgi:hypothetical protein